MSNKTSKDEIKLQIQEESHDKRIINTSDYDEDAEYEDIND